ncbi:MAG: gliding motility-associated C-terminal domain-containing protein, partial [Saprospiraceae bacterium]
TYFLAPIVAGGVAFKWYRNDTLLTGQNNATLSISIGGIYRLDVSNAQGCIQSAKITMIVKNKPRVEFGLIPPLNKCEGDTVYLYAGADGIKIEWFKDGVQFPNILNIYKVTSSGTYRVVVTNSANCVNSDELKISYFAKSVIEDLPPIINACQGTSPVITAKVTDFQSLQWYYENNPINGANGLSITANNSGTYSIEATNLAGCKVRKSTRVDIRSLPVVNLGSEITSCIGSPLSLNAGSEGVRYRWAKDGVSIADTTSLLPVNQNGKYQVTVTNQFNCSTKSEVNVAFIAGPTVTLNGDKTICEGQSHFIIATTNAVGPEIRWLKDGSIIDFEHSLSLAVTQKGTYEVSIIGGSPACEVRKSVVVNVHPRPALNLGNDQTLCEGQPYPILTAGVSNSSFVWTLNGVTISDSSAVIANKSGTYIVRVKNSFDCERTERVKITIDSLPIILLQNEYIQCGNATVLIAPLTNGVKFEWKKNDTIIIGQINKTISLSTPGNYSVKVEGSTGCKTEKSFKVTMRPIPIVSLGIDTSLCPEQIRILKAGKHTSYKWSDGSIGDTLTVNAGKPTNLSVANYTVTVTNEFGCQSSDTINITLFPILKPNITAPKTTICSGESVQLTASGGQIYTWTDPNGNSLSTLKDSITIAKPDKTTTYTVSVTNNLCSQSIEQKSIEIKVFPIAHISAGKDTCAISGKSIRLFATGGVAYQWDNQSLINGSSDVPNPLITVTGETIFNVTITDVNGCTYTDDVKVCAKNENIKFVTIITPNGDGKNDVLFFEGLNDFPNNELQIFNRWGKVIFIAQNYQFDGELFDGSVGGNRLPADTYYYILRYDKQTVKSALTILWNQ